MKYTVPYVTARLIHEEVVVLAPKLTKGLLNHTAESAIHMKQIMVALAKISELEKMLKPLYKEHNELSVGYKELQPSLKFIEYLRNKFAGHSLQSLVEKALEWRPEIQNFVCIHKGIAPWALNLLILETAINTYVENGKHKFFDSESDLVTKLDYNRFLEFLDTTVKESVTYLEGIIGFFTEQVEPRELELKDWLRAAATNFEYLTKGK